MNVFQPMGMVSSALTMSMFTTSFTPPKRSRLANSGRSSTTATSYSSCVASLAIASPTWPPPTMTSRGLAMTGSMSSSVSSSSATVRAVPRRRASAAAARARAGRALDPHRPAADEAGVPRELLGQLVLAQGGVSGLDDPLRLDEGVTFDAAPAEGADQAAEVVDQELRAHDLRGAADRPDDRRDGESAALPLELG